MSKIRTNLSTAREETGVNRKTRPEVADLFIIGGGINGCGIARDASGRGLYVALAEQAEVASATSSS